jgi:osmoprotectant transport system permease protein
VDAAAFQTGETVARRVDRVAAAGALIALAGSVLLPLFVLRANRIVSGVAQPLSAGGPAAWALVVLAAVALAVALFAHGPERARAEIAVAALMIASLGWALASAASTLTPDPSSPARVSIGGGSWIAVAGAAVVWFAATRAPLGRVRRAAAAILVAASWVAAGVWGGLARLSILQEYALQSNVFWGMVATHLTIVGVSLAIAIVIGVPLGIASARLPRLRTVALSVVGLIQTVPSLALLGLLVLPLAALGLPGIGPLPAIIALTVYSLLPIVRNTYLGLAQVDPAAVDAGLGMGMSPVQLLLRVEAPLALPLVIEGIRTAAVMIIGIAAVVAAIGVGTLGVLVFTGWGFQADDLVLLGAIPMVLLAVAADTALRAAGRLVTSPGIRVEAR